MSIELSHRPVYTFKPQSIIDQFAHDLYLTRIHKTSPMAEVCVSGVVWDQLKLELKEKMRTAPFDCPVGGEGNGIILFGVRIISEGK